MVTVEEYLPEAGDLVWLDSGCTVDGLWSDFGRAAVVGVTTPSETA